MFNDASSSISPQPIEYVNSLKYKYVILHYRKG